MAEMVTLEAPDGRRIRTDSPTEITDLVSGHGYRVVDNDNGTQQQRKQSKPSSSNKQQQQQQQQKPAHEPDENPIQPQTRTDDGGAT